MGEVRAYNLGVLLNRIVKVRKNKGMIAAASNVDSDYPPLYLKGIEHFNECEFFEAHDIWEELWTEHRGTARKFYQGLIQAAVALHHFGNGNTRGARKVYLTSRVYLEEYTPSYQGLDMEKFLGQYEQCFAEVNASKEDYPRLEVDPELIPEIHLDPTHADQGNS